MRMIESVPVTPGMLVSSTIPEDDQDPWSGATTYLAGAEVMKGHRVWESVQGGNANRDPETDDGTWWIDRGATNRWRAFDGKLQPQAGQSSDVTYVLTLTRRIDAIALFGLTGTEARIVLKDGGGVSQFDETYSLASERQIGGWWDWFFEPFQVVPSLIVREVPGFVGWAVEITISAGSGTRAVGEILLGRSIVLGETLVDTALGFRDFSIKERDQWGGWQITERGYSRTVDFRFSLPQEDVDRVYRAILRNRARMCVFSAGPDTDQFGTTVLGFVNEDGLSIPITTNICFATLSVESLTEE